MIQSTRSCSGRRAATVATSATHRDPGAPVRDPLGHPRPRLPLREALQRACGGGDRGPRRRQVRRHRQGPARRSRGVLLDVVRARDIDRLDGGHAVTPEDLDAAKKRRARTCVPATSRSYGPGIPVPGGRRAGTCLPRRGCRSVRRSDSTHGMSRRSRTTRSPLDVSARNRMIFGSRTRARPGGDGDAAGSELESRRLSAAYGHGRYAFLLSATPEPVHGHATGSPVAPVAVSDPLGRSAARIAHPKYGIARATRLRRPHSTPTPLKESTPDTPTRTHRGSAPDPRRSLRRIALDASVFTQSRHVDTHRGFITYAPFCDNRARGRTPAHRTASGRNPDISATVPRRAPPTSTAHRTASARLPGSITVRTNSYTTMPPYTEAVSTVTAGAIACAVVRNSHPHEVGGGADEFAPMRLPMPSPRSRPTGRPARRPAPARARWCRAWPAGVRGGVAQIGGSAVRSPTATPGHPTACAHVPERQPQHHRTPGVTTALVTSSRQGGSTSRPAARPPRPRTRQAGGRAHLGPPTSGGTGQSELHLKHLHRHPSEPADNRLAPHEGHGRSPFPHAQNNGWVNGQIGDDECESPTRRPRYVLVTPTSASGIFRREGVAFRHAVRRSRGKSNRAARNPARPTRGACQNAGPAGQHRDGSTSEPPHPTEGTGADARLGAVTSRP